MTDEHWKEEYAKDQARYWHLHALELTRATMAFEHAALRPLFWLNGGALVAVLAFLGATWGKTKGLDFALFYWALGLWTAGLILAAAVPILGYRSQFAFMKAARRSLNVLDAAIHDDPAAMRASIEETSAQDQSGKRLRSWAEWLGLTSLGFFIFGVFVAIRSFVVAASP